MRLYLAALFVAATARSQTDVQLKTASTHPMQFYLSLPQGWTASRKWPVVVAIESANRQFQQTAEAFAHARGAMPFIVVTPLVLTNGGPGYRQVPTYHYSAAVWDQAEQVGRCRFDAEGIAAVAADVRKLYGGEDRYFLTGWEAGGHTVWAMLFRHPEVLRAVALSGPNYQGRCLEDGFSSSPARTELPVRIFTGGAPNRYIVAQSAEAKTAAEAHGYGNVSQAALPEKPHGPLADEVLAYFTNLTSR
jgi:dienelactone hydrolase